MLSPTQGKITNGLQLKSLVNKTLEFVTSKLPEWRDDPDRTAEKSEELLNSQLCDFLSTKAIHDFPMVRFHHEQRQARDRRVDLAAKPTDPIFIEANKYSEADKYSIYDPFLVLEGKRLPAPTKNREHEYVRGKAIKSGGIQRFKLGLHGAEQGTAAMIGYVQKDSLKEIYSHINSWICELADISPIDNENWSTEEQLSAFSEDLITNVSISHSHHCRSENLTDIHLHHLWVKMDV